MANVNSTTFGALHMSLVRKLAAAGGIAAASLAIVATTAGTASADSLQPRHYSSLLLCQTAGNTLAQQGKLTGFNCVQAGPDNFLLYIW
ncbi:hypothetical protein [Amycolatopsis pigmentata]|uniref:Uncharacterized protein n=1 Tax=Amycolatopsis pigmentata TaxID=450801 RepID=A0ABW5G2G9_9PSEU